jgi:hypothetical protein
MHREFPRYRKYDPAVEIRHLTPNLSGCWHRFFDTSPISPSGRYLAVTRYPYENMSPAPGEEAEVVAVDLETRKAASVAKTRGWDTQLGAQCQWGKTDRELYFNDMDTTEWRPFGVKLDLLNGLRQDLEGTVYMVSPDGKKALSPDLTRMCLTQTGYGVRVPPNRFPLFPGAPEEDGIWITDTVTGKQDLLLPLSKIVSKLREQIKPCTLEEGDFYCFHLKWNRQQTRIMAVIRWRPRGVGGARIFLITLDPDGKNILMAMPPSVWGTFRGHHPQWHPDGEHIIMNLALEGNEHGLRFVQFRWDGTDRRVLVPGMTGSGHPSIHPEGRFLLTDWYEYESPYNDGTTALRWINLETGEETELVRIAARPSYEGPLKERRVDPHPVFDRSGKRIIFNACPNNVRGVYMAVLE